MHMTLELLIMRLYLAVNLLSTSAPRTPLYLLTTWETPMPVPQNRKPSSYSPDVMALAMRCAHSVKPIPRRSSSFTRSTTSVAQTLKMLLHGAFQIIRNVLRRDDKFSAH